MMPTTTTTRKPIVPGLTRHLWGLLPEDGSWVTLGALIGGTYEFFSDAIACEYYARRQAKKRPDFPPGKDSEFRASRGRESLVWQSLRAMVDNCRVENNSTTGIAKGYRRSPGGRYSRRKKQRLVAAIREALSMPSVQGEMFRKRLTLLLEKKAWVRGEETPEAFMEFVVGPAPYGLASDVETIRNLIGTEAPREAFDAALRRKRGRPRKAKNRDNVPIIPPPKAQGGNSAASRLRTLELAGRDDLRGKVNAGEMSVNAAMKEFHEPKANPNIGPVLKSWAKCTADEQKTVLQEVFLPAAKAFGLL